MEYDENSPYSTYEEDMEHDCKMEEYQSNFITSR